MPGRSNNSANRDDDQKAYPDLSRLFGDHSGFTGHFFEPRSARDRQEGDLETPNGRDKFYHAQARMYDPATGRFWGVDAMRSEMPSWNGYHYTFNNPVKYVDPDGNMPNLFNGVPARYNPLSQLKGMWNISVNNISNAPSNAAVNVVQSGPEVLDYVTAGSAAVAVGAAGVAIATGPEPVSTVSAGLVAGIAAKTANVSDAAATALSVIDAVFLDGDTSEAMTRVVGTLGGFGAGRATTRVAGNAFRKNNPNNLSTDQVTAMSEAAGAQTGSTIGIGIGIRNQSTPTPLLETQDSQEL